MRRLALVLVFATVALALARAEPPHLVPYAQQVPGSTLSIEMAPVPFRGDAPGFWIERHEVTQAEYEAFLEATRVAASRGPCPALSSFPDVSRPSSGPGRSDVVQVTFAEAAAYAEWLSARTGRNYRLPTEAEWEQACRAGVEEERPLEQRAWFAANADARPHAYGTRSPDRLGVVDMLGNLREWTGDGTAAGGAGAMKGGSWGDAADAVGCAARVSPGGATAGETAGFRVIRPYEDRRR